MKTTAKTIGYNDGLRGTRRQAGRSANGILPMAVAAFQIWLGDTYGLGLTALCLAADAAVIVWLVVRHG